MNHIPSEYLNNIKEALLPCHQADIFGIYPPK